MKQENEAKVEKIDIKEIENFEAESKLKAFFKSKINDEAVNSMLDLQDKSYASDEAKKDRVTAYKKSKGKNKNIVAALNNLEKIGLPSLDLNDLALIKKYIEETKIATKSKTSIKSDFVAYVNYLMDNYTALTEKDIGIKVDKSVAAALGGDFTIYDELKEVLINSTKPE